MSEHIENIEDISMRGIIEEYDAILSMVGNKLVIRFQRLFRIIEEKMQFEHNREHLEEKLPEFLEQLFVLHSINTRIIENSSSVNFDFMRMVEKVSRYLPPQ